MTEVKKRKMDDSASSKNHCSSSFKLAIEKPFCLIWVTFCTLNTIFFLASIVVLVPVHITHE